MKDIPYIATIIDAFLMMNEFGSSRRFLVVAAMLMFLQNT